MSAQYPLPGRDDGTGNPDTPQVRRDGTLQNIWRTQLLSRLAPLGVVGSYINSIGQIVEAQISTLLRVERHFTVDPATVPETLVCTPGRFRPQLFGTLVLENGQRREVQGRISEPGYYCLIDEHGAHHLVICTPDRLRTPDKGWGLQVQLYAARSNQSWGIGDFRDLALICRQAATLGADCVQVSPVHAVAPVSSPQASPYSPASRNFLNLLHVAPGAVPGAERIDLSDLSAAGRELNQYRIIDRPAVWSLKKQALERIWQQVRNDTNPELRSYCARRGHVLRTFAAWCAIAEHQDSSDWRSWPEELHHPGSQAVKQFTLEHRDRVLFYIWCQWVADLQYAQACTSGVEVIADLAVGFDLNSQDAWAYQDELCFDFEIGCPPDLLNPEGQRWGLPPFQPQKLVQAGFVPFIDMLREGLAHAKALRVDHVMQLWRLYWIPVDGSASEGVYVNYPVDAMLAILRLEAARAGAWVVGEDMGTVPSGVQHSMRDIGLLANRSASRTSPADFPVLCVGTSSTHDQVTLAGLLTGYDADQQRKIGKDTDWEAFEQSRRGVAELAGIDPDKPSERVTEEELHRAVRARYQSLADSPSIIVLASLEDASLVRARPNIPSIVGRYPNWSIALPRPVEEIMIGPLIHDLAGILGARR
ncbi:4-alpha-glucanotransferase [Propionibacterium sp.]|uniref:4-alpha-glucanotransferase n=1 Tax=Propionibacterium sp. TaxID=1977903 RepID=UPI0039ED389E